MNPDHEDPGTASSTQPSARAVTPQTFLARVGALLLSAGLLYLVWRIVQPLWQPLLWAILLGALLAPLNSRLAVRLGGRPKLASTITTTGVLAAPLRWLDSTAGVSLNQIQAWVVTAAKHLLEIVASSGGSVFLGAIGTIVSFILMLFVLFFVLRDGPRFAARTVRMLPIEPALRGKLWRPLIEVTRAVFMGIGLTALVQGILLGIGFAIAGVPSALVFGVLGVLFALVPMVGTAIVWIPAVLWLLAQGQPYFALFMLVWGVIVVGGVDNFLRPMLISGRAEVPTLAVFIGVMGGLSAFGFIGLFLGPIVLGLVVALLRFTTEELVPDSGAA